MTESPTETSFFLRHEFAIRRLHSLTGIVPLGLYMCVHLTTNASLLNGVETFQWAVYMIHSPGKFLPLIEWGAIFLPLIFHAVLGVWIAKTGRSNVGKYQYMGNRRYTWQRWTGVIALVYLFLHILHLHGWSHAAFWQDAINGIGLGKFAPYNAGSTLADAMNSYIWPPIYLVGVMACVYHLANGLWTSGITWGLWITPQAQARASKICVAFGLVLAVIALSAWVAAVKPNAQDVAEMKATEDRMFDAAVEAGMVPDNPEKRSSPESSDEQDENVDESGENESETLVSGPDRTTQSP